MGFIMSGNIKEMVESFKKSVTKIQDNEDVYMKKVEARWQEVQKDLADMQKYISEVRNVVGASDFAYYKLGNYIVLSKERYWQPDISIDFFKEKENQNILDTDISDIDFSDMDDFLFQPDISIELSDPVRGTKIVEFLNKDNSRTIKDRNPSKFNEFVNFLNEWDNTKEKIVNDFRRKMENYLEDKTKKTEILKEKTEGLKKSRTEIER